MKINSDRSMAGLQHMAAKAQETRKPANVAEDIPTSATANSAVTETPAAGKKLPPTTGAAQSAQKPDHATGLDRAAERLQQNAAKNPEASGLQHALEMLQRNQERGSAVDTQA